MSIIFPKSNLPESSQPWAREVQKQLQNVITSDTKNEINNAARDNQLNSSLITLTGVVADVKTAADEANAAINGLIGLGSAGGEYTLNASNIVGGTITGITLQTAASGRRVLISGTTATFYDESNLYSGTITVTGSGNESVMQINGPFTSRSISFSSVNTYIAGGGGTYINLTDAPAILVNGSITVTGKLTTSSGLQSVFAYGNAVGGAARDLYITSAGNLGTIESSLRVKEEVKTISFPMDAIYDIEPKSFKFKVDIEEFGIDDAITTVGFIAEEMHEAGLTQFVNYGENNLVEGISYTRYVVALQAAIRDLNNRLKQLENGAS